MRPGSQIDRVLRASERYNGVCQADFLLPNVCDEGKPITLVAARIQDLEEKHGCVFEAIGTRSSTKVYRLAGAGVAVQPGGPGPGRKLFEVGPAQYGFADQEMVA